MEADHPEIHGFSLRYKDGWAVLIVSPEAERRRPVYADDITARMNLLGIPSVPAKKIRDIIADSTGEAVPLVEWPSGASLNSKVNISVDDDGMRALAEIVPAKPGGAPADKTVIEAALQAAGITKGVDEEAVSMLLAHPAAGRRRVIARGKTAEKGQSERTECLFVTERLKPWKELSGGRIDLKDLHFIQNRKAGDLLARIVPAVPPEDGYDVFGRIIEAEPAEQEPLLEAGEGVRATAEGLVAEIDGNVLIEDGAVRVEPSVSVKNVDYSTGNFEFDGSVEVEGTVADGFTVRAAGDLQIGKTVGRAHVFAGRNLVLRAGFVGDGEGSCSAEGTLFAKFIENAKATSAGDLFVTEALLQSEAKVSGDLVIDEGRGEIIGGITAVGGNLTCKKIGNMYAGETRIYVGCSPDALRTYHALGAELKTARDNLDDMERRLDYLKTKKEKAEDIEGLEQQITAKRKTMKEGAARMVEMKHSLKAPDGTTVTVKDRIFPGSIISFGLDEYQLGEKGAERAVLRREGGRTVMHGYAERRGN